MSYIFRVLRCLRQPVSSIPVPPTDVDLSGKTVIVTGGNATMGKEVTCYFALQGARTIIACRRPDSGEEAISYIKDEAKKQQKIDQNKIDMSVIKLDLSDLESVKQFCDNVRSKLGPNGKVDILICHAGIASRPYEQSKQGVEIHFAVNHLGHFCLTQNLLNHGTLSKTARVVIVSGDILVLVNGDPDPNLQYKSASNDPYNRAKTANIMHAYALQRKYPDLTVVANHPGVVDTDLITHGQESGTVAWMKSKMLISPKVGLQTTCYCAVEENIKKGIYFHNVWGEVNSHPRTYDEEKQEALWETSQKLCAGFM